MKVGDLICIMKIAGKTIPRDMVQQLEQTYLSESKGEHIPIGDMDIIHLVRAFNKMKNDNQIIKAFNEIVKRKAN